ncbi:helix-turn-helix domain-containing protein [Bacillus atrophaeus]|uniref:HTH-type transcriptional regulator SlrR n=1 Tax=Bacillus atrophaeus TaxID=1452 RepID=UPI002281E67D|nr:helix-turn-helix domain-containing protein [Bacillus atrophaeus]MCY8908215.1 helix-turn-helix domain-containing protein [Bacillus atrophaeus]MEC0837896.1 helix-turn-helix domain-containing protein [Bacillus atrophaeus]MEC0844228.1 helix-turn-helix domain-containing protein [Bacillus atrophaeus]MEC0850514.1 helix-turn-helix domain-containing protein [Bacillus atrophaeus]MEC0864256.1 helix-turn-helix domain-containing protein [Bacillus atrophaeus]
MIGRIIRLYRKRKGYSINQLAVEAGVSKSYLSKIERGVHTNPSIQFLKKVSETLEVELTELFDAETILHQKTGGEEEWRLLLVQAVQAGMVKEELFTFTNRLKSERTESASYRNRKLTESNIEEWKALMLEAKEMGLSVDEVQTFLKTMGR